MRMSQKAILLLVFALMLSMFLAACASEPDDGTEDADTEEEATDDDGDDAASEGDGQGGDLVVANLSDVSSLDPAGSNDVPSSNVQQNIFERLTELDGDMEVQPGLAESWEQVEDNVWEFYLREGIEFHDGSEFNAEVVKANIDRILDPDVASPRAIIYEMVEEIEVVDDYTVRFVTEYPFAPLPAHLAHSGGGMVALEQIEADYEAMENGEEPGSVVNENPIGTGYFAFDEWESGEYVRLVRNENYWDGNALLDSVTFKVVAEDLTRVAEVTTGDSHIGRPLSPSDVAQIEGADGVHVHEQPSVSLSYIGFNVEKEPFDDPLVRQAMNMAIDKSQIIEGIYDGKGIPAIGPIPPDVVGYNDSVSGLEYDLEEAEALLAEAGYEDGFSTTLWTNDNRERIDAATNVQAQLQEIGIEVEIEVMEFGAYLEQTANGEHDMFVLGWSTATGDADYALYNLFHSEAVGDTGNRSFIRDDELDELLDAGRREGDPEERQRIYTEAQEKLSELAPMLYLHHQLYLTSVRDEVQGFEMLPTEMLQLKDVYIEE